MNLAKDFLNIATPSFDVYFSWTWAYILLLILIVFIDFYCHCWYFLIYDDFGISVKFTTGKYLFFK